MSGWHIRLQGQLGALAVDVDLRTPSPRVVLVGPNGAGKSTVLRAVAGAPLPLRGRVEVARRVLQDDGAAVRLPPEARRVGYLPQGYGLFAHLSAQANVAFGLTGPQAAERALAALARVGAAHLAPRRPPTLSGGEQQRVALARALAIEPVALLLDEPLAALDVGARRTLRASLAADLDGAGRPALLVTHDPRDVRAFGGVVAVVEGGRITQLGPWEALRTQPASPFVAELLGEDA
ncbi:MAG: ATP-binding cassette domain-containing protein [Myxococcales bacterium]|nr:ATP-binding cassette domain-containing protein [Myxococcales bacterium]